MGSFLICLIFWESKIKKKTLKHFQKRGNDPYFPRLIKTFKDPGRNNVLKIKVLYAQYLYMWVQMNSGAQYHWHDSFKNVFLFLPFLNFKVDFLATENQTGTTVGKPRKFCTIVGGVDFFIFPCTNFA